MRIEVLGTGCAKCNALEAAVVKTANELGIPYELSHVTDISKFAFYGVMVTPALVIDGQVKISGKLPSEAELSAMLSASRTE
ncbi:MAG TPA: thioredoxin family protein [Actinobacteria bacterium]|nr:thioredoxin family protein [Actinomycetota bacterium]